MWTYPFRKETQISFGFNRKYPQHIIDKTGITYHHGIDFVPGGGSDLLNIEEGIVSHAGIAYATPDRGAGIVIIAENKNVWRYWHLGRIFVRNGQWVKSGERLGLNGHDHTHIELQQKRYRNWLNMYYKQKEVNMSFEKWFKETEDNARNTARKLGLSEAGVPGLEVIKTVFSHAEGMNDQLKATKKDLWMKMGEKLY